MTENNKTAHSEPASNSFPVRLGVIGAGQIARIVLPMLAEQSVTIDGITDINSSAAQALAKTLGGVLVFNDVAALLADSTIEAVYIATPPHTHKGLVIASIKAGKHVICEKPWTLNAEEAHELSVAALAHPELSVGCCSSRFCFSPAAQAVRRIVAEGTLGRLRQVRLIANTNPPKPLDQLPGWQRQVETAGGGLTADWGGYELEWLRTTLGSYFAPVEVTAWLSDWRREGTGLDSGYHVVVRCASGLEVVMSRQSEVGPHYHRVELRGEDRGLDVPFAPDTTDVVARLHSLKSDGKTLETTAVSEPTNDYKPILFGPVANFAEAVRGRGEITASPEGQILVHTVVDAIYRSAREHTTVSVKL